MEELTLTLNVQVPFPVTVAPLSEITRVVASVVNVPLHCVAEEVAMVSPKGNVSVKLTLDMEVEPGLVTVKVNVDVPPDRIVFGENDLVRLALIILA